MRKLIRAAGLGAFLCTGLVAAEPADATNMSDCFRRVRDLVEMYPDGARAIAEGALGRHASSLEIYTYWTARAYQTCLPW